ncbi:MAG: DUF438 domain-containing protein [Spirochaetaceae bacterium]|nr:DUF438 domain-containing protein [Spirochaetaceae bacterium]
MAAMEQALIAGGFPVEEIQRLCDVHVEVSQAALARSGAMCETAIRPRASLSWNRSWTGAD